MVPVAPLTRAIGAPVAIDVQGFDPGAPVTLSLDTDGDPATSADRVVFGPSLVASPSGAVVGYASPVLVEPGTYRLVATSGAAVAVSSAPLTLVSKGYAVLVEGAPSQEIEHVAALRDGRVAVTGTVDGAFVASTTSGSVSTPRTRPPTCSLPCSTPTVPRRRRGR